MVRFHPVSAARHWLSEGISLPRWTDTGRTDPSVAITPLQSDETAQAGAVLADAFRTENFTTAAFGGYDDHIESAFGTFMARRMDAYLAHSQPLFVARVGETIVGVVILVRPSFSLPTRKTVRIALTNPLTMGRLFRRADPRQTARVLELHEPPHGITDTHYDLKYIAVAPRWQGVGIGGALLRAVATLLDCDPGTAGGYLVTANGSNRRLYERHGYETCEVRCDERIETDEGPLQAYHMTKSAESV